MFLQQVQGANEGDGSVPEATAGPVPSQVTLAETAVSKQKSSRRANLRKTATSAKSSRNKKCHKRTLQGSPASRMEVYFKSL